VAALPERQEESLDSDGRRLSVIHSQFDQSKSPLTLNDQPMRINNSAIPVSSSALQTIPVREIDWGDDLARIEREERKQRKKKAISRRARIRNVFMGGLATVALATGISKPAAEIIRYAVTVQEAVTDNSQTWQDANLPPGQFLAKYNKEFAKINIGCTFIPDEFGVNLLDMDTTSGEAAYNRALNSLDYIHNELHMNEIAIGIRWDNVVDANGNYTLKFYKPFLDKLVQYKMRFDLDLGTKNPGWKEQNVPPQKEAELVKIATSGGVVYAGSELAKDDLAYQTEVFKSLVANYSEEDLELIIGLQFQNEFNNHFGDKDEQVVFDKGVIVEDAKNSKRFLPGRRIIVSSAGPLNIDPVIDAIKALKADDPSTPVGLSIHDYSVDAGGISIPLIGDENVLNTPLGRYSPLFYDRIALNELKKAAQFCDQTKDCEENIGEAEGTAWDGNVGLPGDKVEDFQYELLNSIQILNADDNATNDGEVRYIGYWGIWNLVENKDDPKNQIIIRELEEINSKNIPAVPTKADSKNVPIASTVVPLATYCISGKEPIIVVDFGFRKRVA